MKNKSGEDRINSQVLFELEKSKKQRIRCSLGQVKSSVFVDLRIFYEDSVTGCYEASRSGFTFHPELITSLIQSLETARRQIFKTS